MKIENVTELKEVFSKHNKDNYSIESYKILLDDILGKNNEINESEIDTDYLSNHYFEFNNLQEAFLDFEGDCEFERLKNRIKDYFKGEPEIDFYGEVDSAIEDYFYSNDILCWELSNKKVLLYSKE